MCKKNIETEDKELLFLEDIINKINNEEDIGDFCCSKLCIKYSNDINFCSIPYAKCKYKTLSKEQIIKYNCEYKIL